MIKAIVVDDEKLVRKGFISLIDWVSFGITIVGEAADGKAALELLERQEANLMFTDITMPGLSGFDLINQVRFRYPHIHSVVLTCHHEFDYAQKALRLGAIDYIVKTLLEMDNVDEVMNRIVERIRYEGSSRTGSGDPQDSSETLLDRVLALVPLKPALSGKEIDFHPPTAYPSLPDSSPAADFQRPISELLRLPLLQRQPMIELEGGVQIAPLTRPIALSELQQELGGAHAGSWMAALVTGLGGKSAAETKKLLTERLPKQLFYRLPNANTVMAITRIELESAQLAGDKSPQQKDQTAQAAAFQEWSELKWALYDTSWNNFMQQMLQLRPDVRQIREFAARLLRDWSPGLRSPQETSVLAADARHMFVWNDWKIWFRRFADLVQRRMIALSLSRDVMYSLIRAILYMRAHAGDKINQADVAAHISMSRSYFSQCFAKFAGLPFGEVLRELRIDRAKALLLESEIPVYEVAASAGFEDEKYFSRVFRDRVGILPTEFRAQGRK